MTAAHFVVPDGIDDPARPSGGNSYDRHLSDGLAAIGRPVREHAVAGFWEPAGAEAVAGLADAVGRLPDGAVVLLDGLVAANAPEVLAAHARRLRLVVLVHMPLGGDREQAALEAATAVVATSAWSRGRLLELHGVPADRVHVAEPGADAAGLAAATAGGGELLCVAAVIPGKGHDVLLDALDAIGELSWRCVCVGSLDRDPGFAQELRRRASDRVDFAGPRGGAELDRSYAAADLLVLPSRAEAYGMVLTEALARGVPAVATDVGGVTEALGHGAGGIRPGLLVPAEDPAALAAALRDWLGDAALRERLRRAARERRETLPRWTGTAWAVAEVLAGAAP